MTQNLTKTLRPASPAELRDILAGAARDGTKLALCGGGSKRHIGRAEPDASVLSLGGLSGVVDYDPAELVLTVQAGTPLAEIEALLAERNQMLAFAPFDHGPLFGEPTGAATIGGVIAAGIAGPLRLMAGSARDHLLGFHAVSGRGESFVGGAKVVKNVTGYDLPKLMSGSWGRLAALTELTVKALPRPGLRLTRLVQGLAPAEAVALMSRVMGSAAEVSAAAYVPASAAHGGAPVTALLLSGFPPSVASRAALLDDLTGGASDAAGLENAESDAFWQAVACPVSLPADRPLWRLAIASGKAAALIAELGLAPADYVLDWAGGLVWLASDLPAETVRAAAAAAQGHATLVRASEALRDTVPALPPRDAAVAALEERVRRAFDPAGLFETGRF